MVKNRAPLTYAELEKIITEAPRIDWYGVLEPEPLCSLEVRYVALQIEGQINKLVAEDAKTTADYIEVLRGNIQRLPYTMNHDGYLIKKREIEKRYDIVERRSGEELMPKAQNKKKSKRNKKQDE